MKKIFESALVVLGLLFVLVCGMFVGSYRQENVHAQVDSTLAFGANFNATLDATEYLNVPVCSKAAGCVANLEVCNMLPGTSRVDSTHCLFIGNGLVAGSVLWLGINQTVTVPATATTPAQTTSSPFQIGTGTSNVTAAEVRQTP